MDEEKKFSKFLTFSNNFTSTQFASYHKQLHGMLMCKDDVPGVYQKNLSQFTEIHESFTSHHWHLIQMSKEYSGQSDTFPIRIYLNYAIDDQDLLAHVISYELWIESEEFKSYMITYGTFPFEVFLNQLIRKMLSRCNEIPPCNTIQQISDSQYNFLLDTCPKIHHWNEKYPLFKHEVESLHWMYNLEQQILKRKAFITVNQMSIPILNTGYYYDRTYDLITNVQTNNEVRIPIRGGILTDMIGSGKTCTSLALIMSDVNNAKLPHDILMDSLDKTLFFKSRATLIITPNTISQQWLQEIQKFILVKQLKIVFVTNMREFKKVKLNDLLQADIVLSTDSFLGSKRYADEVSYQARCLIRFPFVDHETSSIVNSLAWRIAVNKSPPGFVREGCVPLESIRFKRIIVDEIHAFFKNKSFPPIHGCFHWGLTGTPMFQNSSITEQYVQFVSKHPSHWVPNFMVQFMDKCVHRFEGLILPSIVRHLYLVEHTEREKQLLRCYDNLNTEKMIQLCSYFSLVDIRDMNQKIRLFNIDEIIRTVKKDKRSKVRDIESKIKYHDMAIRNITNKIECARQEMKNYNHVDDDIMIIDVTPNHEQLQNEFVVQNHPDDHIPYQATTPTDDEKITIVDVRDTRDILKSRKRRLDRMISRRKELEEQKLSIQKSIGFFESKIDTIKQQSFEHCPICMVHAANIITSCGHLFCRSCIVKCFKTKYQCPICKANIKPSDACEIQINREEKTESSVAMNTNLERYGTKLSKILELIQSILNQKEKVILIIQWTSLMNYLSEMLKENGIESSLMVGNIAQQNSSLKKFKSSTTSVLIMDTDNQGLDLVDANHLIFVHALCGEKYMVKSQEDQCIARIHRIQQARKVHIYWFISRATIEETIYLNTRCFN
jgi:SWI/SNF-related matrix-associated actin-dependent regulator of chromatin subfamily A3